MSAVLLVVSQINGCESSAMVVAILEDLVLDRGRHAANGNGLLRGKHSALKAASICHDGPAKEVGSLGGRGCLANLMQSVVDLT